MFHYIKQEKNDDGAPSSNLSSDDDFSESEVSISNLMQN